MTRIHHRLPHPLLIFAVAGFLLLPGQRAYAGCQINIYVKNTGNAPLTVYNKWTHAPSTESSVKIKLGTWRGLYTGGWWPGWSGRGSAPPERFDLDPGQKDGDNYDATFNCGAKRRYKIPYFCTTGKYANRSFTKYYPSATGDRQHEPGRRSAERRKPCLLSAPLRGPESHPKGRTLRSAGLALCGLQRPPDDGRVDRRPVTEAAADLTE